MSDDHLRRASDEYRDQAVEQNIRYWNRKLEETAKIGDAFSRIEEFMKGKYRDKAIAYHGGTGRYDVFYLIDDFVEVCVWLDVQDKLIEVAFAMKKGDWLRGPDGDMRIYTQHRLVRNHTQSSERK